VSESSSSGSTEVRLWKIADNKLHEIQKPQLDFEERLEEWLTSDISIIASNLLIIGRQVKTDYSGYVDLLCMDEKGDLVIIELKRDKTPREITAQVLDYASWVKQLSPDKIQVIAENFLHEGFEAAFNRTFGQELPESLNQEHRMLIVGSEIDGSSSRIITYLSETYGVSINAVIFNYFKEDGEEFLARTFLIEQLEVSIQQGTSSKRLSNLTFEQLQAIADEHGVGDIYTFLLNELQKIFGSVRRTMSTATFAGPFKDVKNSTMINLIPAESDLDRGLCWQVYDLRLSDFLGIKKEELLQILPTQRQPWKYGGLGEQKKHLDENVLEEWSGYKGYMKMDDAKKFIDALFEIKQKK
jgi:uncharacterized protein YeaO (DUF488 family)